MSQSLCKGILALDDSIRFVGVANNFGTLIADEYRDGLNPMMNKEETERYAIQAVTRVAMREDFTTKLGSLEYSIGKYAKLIRAVIPIKDETYLIISFDIGSDVVGIVENKIIRFLKGHELPTDRMGDELGLTD